MEGNFPENTSNIKLIVSDFDGTLAGADHKISQKIQEAIKRWMDSGRHFTIASGRQFLMIKQDAEVLSLKTPLIVRGGAEIVNPDGKIIFSELIDRDIVKDLTALMVSNGYGILVEVDNVLYGNFEYGVEEYPEIIEKPLSQLPHADSPKINIRVSADKVKKTEEFMDNHVIPKFPMLHMIRSYNALGMSYDITSLKGTKNLAVLELIKYLDLNRSEVVGVGDGYNDFPLLEASGFKVAMGNANDELKEIADVIIPSLDEDGLAFLIDKLLTPSS